VATGMAYHKNLDKYTYKTIEIIDTPESQITDYFDECFDYIDNSIANFGGCLIHCNAGGIFSL
jgi:atypical dual specificity phosphatase